jgi:hypothetical protein
MHAPTRAPVDRGPCRAQRADSRRRRVRGPPRRGLRSRHDRGARPARRCALVHTPPRACRRRGALATRRRPRARPRCRPCDRARPPSPHAARSDRCCRSARARRAGRARVSGPHRASRPARAPAGSPRRVARATRVGCPRPGRSAPRPRPRARSPHHRCRANTGARPWPPALRREARAEALARATHRRPHRRPRRCDHPTSHRRAPATRHAIRTGPLQGARSGPPALRAWSDSSRPTAALPRR